MHSSGPLAAGLLAAAVLAACGGSHGVVVLTSAAAPGSTQAQQAERINLRPTDTPAGYEPGGQADSGVFSVQTVAARCAGLSSPGAAGFPPSAGVSAFASGDLRGTTPETDGLLISRVIFFGTVAQADNFVGASATQQWQLCTSRIVGQVYSRLIAAGSLPSVHPGMLSAATGNGAQTGGWSVDMSSAAGPPIEIRSYLVAKGSMVVEVDGTTIGTASKNDDVLFNLFLALQKRAGI